MPRAAPRAAGDDRRGDVRDPRAHRPGVRRSLRRQVRRGRGVRRATRGRPAHADVAERGDASTRRAERDLASRRAYADAASRATHRSGARRLRRLAGVWTPRSRSRSPTVRTASTRRAPPPRTSPRRSASGWPRPPSRPGVDGHEVDLGRPLADGDDVAIITDDSDDGRHVLRHSTAHVMAQAVTQLFPGAKFSIGPAIENGFYYDFELPGGATFSDDDLAAIEARMREIVKADQPFVRSEVSADEALEVFADQPYKVEIIERVQRARRRRRDRRRSTPARSTPATRSASTATRDGVRRPVQGPARAVDRAASATSSCRRSPAPTGAATRRARCCSASTARRGSPRRRCRPTSTSSPRPRSATTASSPTSSTCSASRTSSAAGSRSGTPRAPSCAS